MSKFVSNLLLVKKSSVKIDKNTDYSYANTIQKSIESLIKRELIKEGYKNPKILKEGPYPLTDDYGKWVHSILKFSIENIPKEINIPNFDDIINRKIKSEIKVKSGIKLDYNTNYYVQKRSIALSIFIFNERN